MEKIINKQKQVGPLRVLTSQQHTCIQAGMDLYQNNEQALLDDIYQLYSNKSVDASVQHLTFDNDVQVFDMNKIQQRYKNASQSEKGIKAIMRKFDLDDDLGYRKLMPVTQSFIEGLRDLKKKYPNCSEFLNYVSQFGALSLCRADTMKMYFPPVLLAGPPGVGKTAIVREVTKLLDVSYKQLDMATITSSFVISGASSVWSDAKTGCIVDLLRDGHAANPMVILDELDKVSTNQKHDPLGGLYTLLEREAARDFTDEALDIPIDASHVLYVATANELTLIPEPLLSRFLVIHIDDVKGQHHQTVTQSIYQSIIDEEKVGKAFKKKLSKDIFDLVEPFSPREVKRILMRAMAKSACRMRNNSNLEINESDLTLPNTGEVKMGFM